MPSSSSSNTWTRKYRRGRSRHTVVDSWFSSGSRSKDYQRLHRNASQIVMVGRKFPHPQSQLRRRRKRQGKPRNAYLRAVRLPSKKIVLWSSMSGTKGKWLYHISLSDLIAPYVSTYDEFRVVSLRVTYKPDNATSADGLCAGVLMDQNGFGEYGSASETAWFQTIGSMPGSKIKPRFVTTTYFWRPTEPNSKEWRSYQRSETATYKVATFYMADDGKESAEYGGILEISGLVLGRGRYYNAPTVRQLVDVCSKSCSCCLKSMAI